MSESFNNQWNIYNFVYPRIQVKITLLSLFWVNLTQKWVSPPRTQNPGQFWPKSVQILLIESLELWNTHLGTIIFIKVHDDNIEFYKCIDGYSRES